MSEFRKNKWVARSIMMLALLTQIHLFAAPFAMAQTTGALQGVVTDPQGAVVANATVRVINSDTERAVETTTNDEGFYRVTNLIPGNNYRVEVTATGFAPKTLDRLPVRLGAENEASVQLSVSGGGETVEVTAGAQLIESTQSQLSTNYTPEQLTQLPYVGSIDNLALLTPGVVTPGDADFANGIGISANGNRGRSNNFQIDGQDNNDNSVAGPSLTINNSEAIGEYQVITNSFSAEFGRNAGAQVNVITKPGTNNFHGTLFEYFQNSRMNARDNIEKKQEEAYTFLAENGFPEIQGLADRAAHPDPFTDNRYGVALGGPIVKEKAFFFATYERETFRGEATTNNLGSGSLSNLVVLPGDSLFLDQRFGTAATAALVSNANAGGPAFTPTGSFFIVPPLSDTNNDGVPDDFVFAGGGFAPLAVVSTAPGSAGRRTIFGGEAIRLFKSDFTSDNFITRVDYNVTNDDRITGRYIWDRDDNPLATGRFLAGAFFDVPSTNHNLGVTYTKTLSSRFVNEGRFNFSRLSVEFGDTSDLPGAGIGFAGGTRSVSPSTQGLMVFGTPNNLPQSRKVDTYQFQDTVTATLGTHGLKFGADIRHQRVNNFFLPNFLGTNTFRSGGALPPGTFFNLSGTARTTATQFENFVLGRPSNISFALGDPNNLTTQNDYFFFVQDDWRIRSNLTLNLGLRYEVSTTPFNPIIDDLNAREADPSTAIFDPSFPLEFRTTQRLPIDKNNFGPRVGFAWTPNFGFLGERFSNGRTVIRGGFSIAYDPPYFNIVLNTITAAPFAAAGVVNQTPGTAGAVDFPFLPQTIAELNLTPGTNGGDPRLFNQTRVDPNFYNPYTISFNFGVQQELFRGSVLEVRYVASRIRGQFQTINGNPDLRLLAQAGQILRGDPGAFTSGILPPPGTQVGTPANGFATRPGTNGNGRLDPNFGVTRTRINGASSNYDGLQVRFDSRIRNQLTLNANYTFSKTIDNVSEIFGTFAGGQSVPHSQDPFDRNDGERGLSAFHRKHNFSSGFLWDLPFFQDQRGVVGKILGGFQINGILRFASGQPWTPTVLLGNYDLGFDGGFISGVGSIRAFSGNPDAPQTTIAFGAITDALLFGLQDVPLGSFIVYDTGKPGTNGTIVSASEVKNAARIIYNDFATFANFGTLLGPLFGLTAADLETFQLFGTVYGDEGRNTFIGEKLSLVNMSVFKNLKLTESKALEFRVEAFNIFNRRNFGVPDVITEDAAAGTSVGSYANPGFNNGGNRTMRLGVRFIF